MQKKDTQGKYEKSLKGEYQNFTGVNDVYEEPKHVEITIDTEKDSIEEATKKIVKFIKKKYMK